MVPNTHAVMVAVERGLEKRIANVPTNKPYSMEFFLSKSPHVPGGNKQMGIYSLQTSEFVNPQKIGTEETNIWEIASNAFLRDKVTLFFAKSMAEFLSYRVS